MTERVVDQLPMSFREQIAQQAAALAKQIAAPSGDKIRSNGNLGFTTPDGLEGEELEVVVLDFVSVNAYYDSPYDADSPVPPACFAIGPEVGTLTPSDNSPDKQSSSCSACEMNQFGSALAGKGKACKNTRLIAVVPWSAVDQDPKTAPIWVFSVPASSIKGFDSYVNSLINRHHVLPLNVVTKMTMDKTVKWAAPRFEIVSPIPPDTAQVLFERREEARARLVVEPDVSGYKPPTRKRR